MGVSHIKTTKLYYRIWQSEITQRYISLAGEIVPQRQVSLTIHSAVRRTRETDRMKVQSAVSFLRREAWDDRSASPPAQARCETVSDPSSPLCTPALWYLLKMSSSLSHHPYNKMLLKTNSYIITKHFICLHSSLRYGSYIKMFKNVDSK